MGLDRSAAATLLGVYGISTVAGRVLTGFVLDQIKIYVALTMTAVMAALALIFLVLGYGPLPAIIAAVALFGFVVGSEVDCLSFCTVRMFGRRAFGGIYAILGIGVLYTGTGLGPALFSAVAESYGSYRIAFAFWTLAVVGAAALFMLASRTPNWRQAAAPAD